MASWMLPPFSRSTALGRPSFTLKTVLQCSPALRSAAAVPRVATSWKPSSAKRLADLDGLRLVVIVDADEDRALFGQRAAGADLRFQERLAEVHADAHHFAGGAHLRSERRIDAGEFVEREDRRLHEVLRHGELARVRSRSPSACVPHIRPTAIFGSATPVALLTYGTVREARGFTSST